MHLSLISLINSIIIYLLEYFSIFIISFFSNTFSAISGGGAGLIQLPALILSGIPYYQALATHKFATVALGIGGSIRNYKSLKNDFYILWQILFFGISQALYLQITIQIVIYEVNIKPIRLKKSLRISKDISQK